MRINVTKNLDAAAELQTKEGNALKNFIEYCTQAFEQIIRAINGQLNFKENFNCTATTLDAYENNSEQRVNAQKKPIAGIIPLRVMSSENKNAGYKSFQWWVDASGYPVVKLEITNTPTERVKVSLVIFYE